MAELYYQAIGRRKEAVAKVRLVLGDGKRKVNGRSLVNHFPRERLVRFVEEPFRVTDTAGKFDLHASIRGGGLSGHAGALRLGIARALVKFDDSLRNELKSRGLLTRDPREKERKKYGRVKARKRFQFSKR